MKNIRRNIHIKINIFLDFRKYLKFSKDLKMKNTFLKMKFQRCLTTLPRNLIVCILLTTTIIKCFITTA